MTAAFLAAASLSGWIPLSPTLPLLTLPSHILHHCKITFSSLEFWEGSPGDTGGEEMLLWPYQVSNMHCRIHLVVFSWVSFATEITEWFELKGILKITSFQHFRLGCSGPHPAWPHPILSMGKKQKRRFLGFVWVSGCSWVSRKPGLCWSCSSGQGRQHICLICLRQEWARTQSRDQGWKVGTRSGNKLRIPPRALLFISWFPYSYLHCFPLRKQRSRLRTQSVSITIKVDVQPRTVSSCNYLLNYAQTHQFLEDCGHM